MYLIFDEEKLGINYRKFVFRANMYTCYVRQVFTMQYLTICIYVQKL